MFTLDRQLAGRVVQSFGRGLAPAGTEAGESMIGAGPPRLDDLALAVPLGCD